MQLRKHWLLFCALTLAGSGGCGKILGFEDSRLADNAAGSTANGGDEGARGGAAGQAEVGGRGEVGGQGEAAAAGKNDAGAMDEGGGGATAPGGGAGGVLAMGGGSTCAHDTCGTTCTDVASDQKNCGSCNHDCTVLPNLGDTSSVTCVAGACVVPPAACAKGYAHCGTDVEQGCETDTSQPGHCGNCTTVCMADKAICAASGCTSSCPSDAPTTCGSSCTSLDNDPKHCGKCETSCAVPAGSGVATCANKTCGIQCAAGSHSCASNTLCANDSDATHCGVNCTLCGTTSNGAAACANNACSIKCNANFTLCPGNTCLNTSTDPKNCGACGHDCTTLNHVATGAGVTCSAGKCVVPQSACAANFGHCTSNGDDGCETNFASTDNCHACGTKCSAGFPNCSASGCTNNCAASTPTLCGTTCSNLTTDSQNCGVCGMVCPATQICSGSTCKCPSGQNLCGNACKNPTDSNFCGPSCTACVKPAGASVSCNGTACVLSNESQCGDGLDNDNDQKTDCQDSDCNAQLCQSKSGDAHAPSSDYVVNNNEGSVSTTDDLTLDLYGGGTGVHAYSYSTGYLKFGNLAQAGGVTITKAILRFSYISTSFVEGDFVSTTLDVFDMRTTATAICSPVLPVNDHGAPTQVTCDVTNVVKDWYASAVAADMRGFVLKTEGYGDEDVTVTASEASTSASPRLVLDYQSKCASSACANL